MPSVFNFQAQFATPFKMLEKCIDRSTSSPKQSLTEDIIFWKMVGLLLLLDLSYNSKPAKTVNSLEHANKEYAIQDPWSSARDKSPKLEMLVVDSLFQRHQLAPHICPSQESLRPRISSIIQHCLVYHLSCTIEHDFPSPLSETLYLLYCDLAKPLLFFPVRSKQLCDKDQAFLIKKKIDLSVVRF